ncbi:hypothetical protein K3G39_18960 [Pontibacter sp. HSC-14F20]|uniref:hypothetical protein n=1 Tax=Pontibacter sp. HSC-14F20 TaxID=2864136 RepID=UPI001C72F1F1|nr:hypothetical protein [Pontibacter sp. HSC-14F20]MBX0335320.1 hypothetical protein [Pontibacter sp. HSC-14F20]
MKTILLFIIFLIPFELFSQNLQPEVYLFTKDETLSMTKFVNNQILTKEDSAACSKLVDYPDKIKVEMSNKAKYNITGLNNDFLVIVFRDISTNQIVPISNGNLNSVEIKTESNEVIYTQSLSNLNGNYLRIELSNVTGFPQAYSINNVSILYNGVTSPKNFYFRYLSRFSSYGNIIKKSPVGFWFPVGQFGTNFQKTPQGIIFNTIPIGVALGTKINLYNDFYIGLSYSLDYTITKADDPANSYSFNSFSHGPILDISDYIHIGYNWYANLTNNETYNREPFYVVGIGVEVVDLLKNKKLK